MLTRDAPSALGVAVVGCGSVADAVHLPLLARLDGARLVAVADADDARRTAAAGRWSVPAYAEWGALLENDAVEAVIVSLPTALHAACAHDVLAARKHLYLEKPIATNAADGRALLEAWQRARVAGMVGFNYRFNPLYERLRLRLAEGRVGEVMCVRTVFASASRDLAEWKRARFTGGGVLLDLASHHIDLMRWMFGREIRRVRASSSSTRAEGDGAVVEMELDGGIPVQSFFSLSAAEDDRIEIYGREGRLAVDRHRSVDVEISRAGAGVSIASRLAAGARSMARRGYSMEKMRAPWHEPSFGAALRHFVRAVRGEVPASPDLLDGLQSLCVVEAAEESARSGAFVDVANGSAASAVVGTAAAPMVEAADDGATALTVVLITPGDFEVIRTTVRHLRAQTIAERIELLICARSRGTLAIDEGATAGFARVHVLEIEAINATGPVRARAIREARGPIVAFAEDHCFPDPGWAAALLAGYAGGHAAVGPVIRNANPQSAVSWADLIIGYGPWLAPGNAGCVEQLPGHNSSYDRATLLAYGDRLEEMMDAETVLQWDLRARGRTLYLEPAATAAHTNFARWGPWVPAMFHHGRVFGATRALGWPATRRAAFTMASPLIPFVRLSRGLRQARRAGLGSAFIARVFPMLLAGLLVDAAGQMLGYALGAGRSREQLGVFEFQRLARNREA